RPGSLQAHRRGSRHPASHRLRRVGGAEPAPGRHRAAAGAAPDRDRPRRPGAHEIGPGVLRVAAARPFCHPTPVTPWRSDVLLLLPDRVRLMDYAECPVGHKPRHVQVMAVEAPDARKLLLVDDLDRTVGARKDIELAKSLYGAVHVNDGKACGVSEVDLGEG